MLAVLCALGSSLMYALASVLQHRGARAQPDEESMRLSLMVRLARHPAWVVGTVCDAGGFVLQFVALGHGPVVVVQPLLVCGLLFALPIGAAWSGHRLAGRDWAAALIVCAGLAAFLTTADPAAGRADAGGTEWAALLVAVSVTAGVLVLLAASPSRRRRAACLAAAAGVLYGAAAALTKTTAHLLGRGIVPVLTHWPVYVLVGIGAAGMLAAQSAFQAGELDASLPTMTVTDPVVSIAIGAVVLKESIASYPAGVLVEVLSLAVMSVGVYILARSEASMADRPGTVAG